jgi:putative Ca2+/H+ antiporter (TMEM165/GDT1 family)
MDISIFLTAFVIVFVAEIIGDKSVYTISSLVTRFSPATVFSGLTIAFGLKMLVAVLIGQILTELPMWLLGAVSGVTYFATAFVLWFRKADKIDSKSPAAAFPASAAVSFASIFFIEWGDIGQISAATLAAQYKAPVLIWLGATSALLVKGILAIFLGLALRQYFPRHLVCYAAIVLCIFMGVSSFWQILGG